MQPKKKNILEKIIKKDYNDELEKILEEKNFGENVKSTLLSILYKIEAAYKDLEKSHCHNRQIDNIINGKTKDFFIFSNISIFFLNMIPQQK